MKLLELRKKYGISQAEASLSVGVPLRTYLRYEKDDNYGSPLKRIAMENILESKYQITETNGILSIEQIKEALFELFENDYKGQIEFCFLFGSYAKGYQSESSDVDLCVSTNLKGLAFVGLSEAIHQRLNKKIDLIRFSNLADNAKILSEILKDGIRIYG